MGQNSAQCGAVAYGAVYFEEVELVHQCDMVNRYLIWMFPDTTRHSYMRVFKNLLRAVSLLPYSVLYYLGSLVIHVLADY